jgi:hypothetical protein
MNECIRPNATGQQATGKVLVKILVKVFVKCLIRCLIRKN